MQLVINSLRNLGYEETPFMILSTDIATEVRMLGGRPLTKDEEIATMLTYPAEILGRGDDDLFVLVEGKNRYWSPPSKFDALWSRVKCSVDEIFILYCVDEGKPILETKKTDPDS